jgi:hypothetical protein
MRRTLRLALLASALLAASLPYGVHGAAGAGGTYVFEGGTGAQHATVRNALAASSFDWSVVPATITIHIAPGLDSEATPGALWLDGDLLDAGSFSWALVQHEYAHQIDFSLFDDGIRRRLTRLLRAGDWSYERPGLPHAAHGCERFASMVAWAYWPSPENALRPHDRSDEAGAVAPAVFRRTLAELLAAAES